MIETLLTGAAFGPVPIGQALFEAKNGLEHEFLVPEGVYQLSAVIVASRFSQQAGPGLSWRNNIPVTPGEKLRVVFTPSQGGSSRLYRGWDILLIAFSATTKTAGKGGKDANPINDGGGNGGGAGAKSSSGGGAGGYTGNGGAAASEDGFMGWAGKGGAGGGGGQTSTYNGTGGGVGLMGQFNDGAAGGRTGGNGSVFNTGETYPAYGVSGATHNGGCRLIWGEDRAFPRTNTTDM